MSEHNYDHVRARHQMTESVILGALCFLTSEKVFLNQLQETHTTKVSYI